MRREADFPHTYPVTSTLNDPTYAERSQLAPHGALTAIQSRIENITEGVRNMADNARSQADALHGPQPESAGAAGKPQEVRNGALGALHDEIDRLDAASNYLAAQLSRNHGLV